MSGHSKWAGIKHHKAAQDSKRGRLFTKIIRELTISARESGSNPDHNPRLRKAIEDARTANMPQDNVKKAIMRGTGELPGVIYEEVSYEGYGPGGVAVLVETTTDNKNRTTAEIRKMFSAHGGNLGENGCVGWMFSKKGFIAIDKKTMKEDDFLNLSLEIGADDVHSDDDDSYEIYTTVEDFNKVKKGVDDHKVITLTAEVTYVPQTYVKLDDKSAEQMLSLMEDLDNHDDVKNVYANFDIAKELMEKISQAQG
ncbi:MAG: YebC/PmpR family DNA-binding transcriptional regulator [Elusimicrobiota bacterium]